MAYEIGEFFDGKLDWFNTSDREEGREEENRAK
jgi:hypothetical protein